MSAGAAAAFALPPPVFVSRVTRAPPYLPPDNAGRIQARAQPIVLCRSATWSKPAGASNRQSCAPCRAAQLVKPPARCREPFPGIARYNAAQYHFIAKISISSGSKRSREELPAGGAIIPLPVDEGEGPRLTPNTMLVDAVRSYFRRG